MFFDLVNFLLNEALIELKVSSLILSCDNQTGIPINCNKIKIIDKNIYLM